MSGTAKANIETNANLVAFRTQVGGSDETKVFIDAEGDLYRQGTLTAYDDIDEVAVIRAHVLLRAPESVIRCAFDDWVAENRYDLEEMKVVGERGPYGERGLVNLTQLTRLHSGAHVQQRRMVNAIIRACCAHDSALGEKIITTLEADGLGHLQLH